MSFKILEYQVPCALNVVSAAPQRSEQMGRDSFVRLLGNIRDILVYGAALTYSSRRKKPQPHAMIVFVLQ